MKRELSDSISLNLRLYRLATKRPTRAARILHRLQALQELYLATLRCLSNSCDFTQLKSSAQAILTMWQIATWKRDSSVHLVRISFSHPFTQITCLLGRYYPFLFDFPVCPRRKKPFYNQLMCLFIVLCFVTYIFGYFSLFKSYSANR